MDAFLLTSIHYLGLTALIYTILPLGELHVVQKDSLCYPITFTPIYN